MCDPLFDNKQIIEEHLRKAGGGLSAFSFVNIFAWQDFFSYDLKMINGCLCVFATHETGTFLYWPPLGQRVSVEVVEECFRIMEARNPGCGVGRIENVPGHQRHLFSEQDYDFFPKGDEFCYYRKEIEAFRGNDYKSQRACYNQFVSGNSYEVKPFESSYGRDCLRLYRQWAQAKRIRVGDSVLLQMLAENEMVHERLIRHYAFLGLEGIVVFVGEELKAYTLGYPVNDSVFCVSLEVTDPKVRGLGAFIFREFARRLKGYSFINVMDDLGHEGLKRAKWAYHPCILFSSYGVRRR